MSGMTTIEAGFLIALVTATIAVIGFFLNRQAAAKKESAALTEMRKDIEYLAKGVLKDVENIVKEITSIRISLEKRDEKTDENIRRLHERIEKFDDGIRRLHERIDEHVREYHP